jgi:hypothetical protein
MVIERVKKSRGKPQFFLIYRKVVDDFSLGNPGNAGF